MRSEDDPDWWESRLGAIVVLIICALLAVTASGGLPWVESWLTSANAASWVQAFGSIAAILASTWIVGRQIRDARRLAAQAVLRERQFQQLLAWEAFLALAQRAVAACAVIRIQLNSRTDVYNVATAGEFDYSDLTVVERWLDRIEPLHTPATLVDNGFALCSAVGRFRRLVERCLADHRAMDAAKFDDWFRETQAQVATALQVVQRVFADVQHLKLLHTANLNALAVDAGRK